MNTELEVRVLDIDKKLIIDKLKSLGAQFVGDWNQIRYCYDFNPKIESKWIRLRTNGIKNTLTIKEIKNSTVEGTKELEIEVNSLEDTDKILEELGYKKRSIQENHRIQYILNEVEIDIDDWPMLNTFVEFEANSLEKIKEVFKMLELDFDKAITDNIQDIYLNKGYKAEDLDKLRFEK